MTNCFKVVCSLLSLMAPILSLAQNPHGEQLEIDCKECHGVDGWTIDLQDMAFSHDETDFPLDGSHSDVDCKSCHGTLVFNEADEDCFSCHTDIHANSVGNDCIRCHSTENWLVDNIPELHEQNGFPLIGAHNMLGCVECHRSDQNLIWNRVGHECSSCHLADFQRAKEPDHIAAGFSTTCDECHNPLSGEWGTENFHLQFPLVYGHDVVCSTCHIGNDYSAVSAECSSCHQQDFDASRNPNHSASRYSNNCLECHSPDPIDWTVPGHHASFPLQNGHNTDCRECHIQEDFTLVSTECISCHLEDYNEVRDPNHRASRFSENCVECHLDDASDWDVPNFHVSFPLTRGHDIDDCKACHKNENYEDISAECISCHRDDYNAAKDPDHQGLNFDFDCTKCHSMDDWTPADFRQHDNLYFPIYSGEHRNEWNSCIDCHTQTNNYSLFSCIDCHEHRRNEMDDEHDDVRNYRYESNACFDCHPRP